MPRGRKKVSDETIIKNQQQTNTGIWVTAGQIESSEHDTKNWTDLQKDYYAMRNSDGVLQTTIDILKYPILMSEYRIEGKNKEVNDYVQWVFDGMKKGFQYFKYHKLLALDYGLSMHEMIVKRGDVYKGKVTNRPIWMNPIQNETIFEFHYDANTEFNGIKHIKVVPEKGQEYIDIDKENLEWYTFNEEYNDIRGRSIFRPIRLFWDAKHKIIISKTTATQRGAGIVAIKTMGDPSSSDKAKIQQIGRSIGQLKDGYISYNKEKIEVELLEPKSQTDVIPLLDYFDKQMFFNTMSQFVISGIGQNGSRAATGEHKSSYEMAASYILQSLETNLQTFVDRVINMSCYANISNEDWPMIHFNSITSTDLQKVATNIRTLYEAGFITKSQNDESYLREMFGMPNSVNVTSETSQALSKKAERKLSKEKLEFEDKVFSLESANEHYQTMSDKISETIGIISKEYLKDIANQLSENRKNDIVVKRSVLDMAVKMLTELYDEGYNRGVKDVKTEVSKLNKSTSLASKPIIKKKSKIINNNVKRYMYNVKNVLENKMAKVSDQFIKNSGGLEQYILGFEIGFKNEKNNIAKSVEEAYTEGRGDTLMDLSEDIETYFYTAKLDKSLCNECAPYDGIIITKKELDEMGLSLNAPINPSCDGGDNCRCQIMAYSVR